MYGNAVLDELFSAGMVVNPNKECLK